MKKDKLIQFLVIFVIFASILITVGTSATTDLTEEHPQREIIIEAKKFSYNPEIIEVNQGDKVTIILKSTDVHHGLYIDGYELKTDAKPGSEGNITFIADKTGKFAMRCSVTCGPFHPYMISYLKVKPDYRLFGSIVATIALFIGSVFLVFRVKE